MRRCSLPQSKRHFLQNSSISQLTSHYPAFGVSRNSSSLNTTPTYQSNAVEYTNKRKTHVDHRTATSERMMNTSTTPEDLTLHTAALKTAIERDRDHLLGIPPVIRPWPSPSSRLPSCLAGLDVEELQFHSEPDHASQEWVSLRIVKPPPLKNPQKHQQAPQQQQEAPQKQQQQRLPVVIFLHCTGASLHSQAQHQADFARRGYVTAAIDTRYHGDRVDSKISYQQALVKAFRSGSECPFLLDVVFDVQKLLDYLESREDVDACRIGVTGQSLGGMIAWLLAAADGRIAAAAPMIGFQNFNYALENEKYHDRVSSIPDVFYAASMDLGQGGKVTKEVVAAVWNKLLPGLLLSSSSSSSSSSLVPSSLKNGCFDAEYSLPMIAPRPFLILNGEVDGRTPKEGVERAVAVGRKAYAALVGEEAAGELLRLVVERGVGHECTPKMWEEAKLFFDKHLMNEK